MIVRDSAIIRTQGRLQARMPMEEDGRNMERHVRHCFVSSDGRDVEVSVVGDYANRTMHDWEIVIGDDCYELTGADGYDAFDFLCSHVPMSQSSRHFQALVTQYVMGSGDMSMEEACRAQDAWDSATPSIAN